MNQSLPTLEDRFVGCLLGLAVGDALGAPFEGRSADGIARQFSTPQQLVDQPPSGRLWYTDDTEMAIGVAETLVRGGKIDNRELCVRFARNFDPNRGYGGGARILLEAIKAGHDHRYLAENYFPGGSFGNGAAMRVAPVGLMFRDDLNDLWEQSRLSAMPTHVHPLGIEGAQMIAMAVALASHSEQIDRQTMFEQIADRCVSVEFSQPLRRAARLDDVRTLGLFGNGIEATSSVVTAIATFGLTPDSYIDTIGNAILLGGDTDTIAAMAGAISGAYLGVQAIPKHLIERLEDCVRGRTYIEKLAVNLFRAYSLRC